MSTLHDRQDPTQLPVLALAAAAGAALLGALAWAAISYATGYEVGYVAWGIGLLVGAAAVRLGGRGTLVGAAAAGLTLVSILAGKVMTVQLLVEQNLSAFADAAYTRQNYDELRRDAADWAELSGRAGEDEVRRFMVEHGYADTEDPEALTAQDLSNFHAWSAPALERLTAERPDFESWRHRCVADSRAAFEAEYSLAGLVTSELNLIDVVFGMLAVTTAFGLVTRAGNGPGGAGPASGQEIRSDDYSRAA